MKGIVGKLALGEADAGFVYATDVRAASSRLIAIPLPKRSQPTVRYEVAVVKDSGNREGALEFVADLLSTDGQARARAGGLRAAVRSPFAIALALAAAARALVPALPIVAIFVDIPPGGCSDGMNDPAAIDALGVTLKTTLIANALILLIGTPAAYLIAHALLPRQAAARHRGRAAARAAAGRRRDRPAGRVRPLRPARRRARRARGVRSRSRRSPSSSRSCSSPARSTCAPRSRRSRRSIRR